MSSDMISPVSNATQAQPVAQPAQKPSRPAPQPAPSADTVKLSNTAQAMAAALQEARETPAQTAKEAVAGDLQARRLVAKDAAAKPVGK